MTSYAYNNVCIFYNIGMRSKEFSKIDFRFGLKLFVAKKKQQNRFFDIFLVDLNKSTSLYYCCLTEAID